MYNLNIINSLFVMISFNLLFVFVASQPTEIGPMEVEMAKESNPPMDMGPSQPMDSLKLKDLVETPIGERLPPGAQRESPEGAGEPPPPPKAENTGGDLLQVQEVPTVENPGGRSSAGSRRSRNSPRPKSRNSLRPKSRTSSRPQSRTRKPGGADNMTVELARRLASEQARNIIIEEKRKKREAIEAKRRAER